MQKYVNILESGNIIKTSWKRDVGDSIAIPGTKPVQFTKVKFALTETEYAQCLENSNMMVKKYFDKKIYIINRGFGFPDSAKTIILQQIYNEVVDEPLMAESYLISLPKFN